MGTEIEIEAGRLRALLWQGGSLAALAIAFRAFEIAITSGELEFGRAVFTSLSVLGLILVGECAVLFFGRFCNDRFWSRVLPALHVVAGLAIAAESRYFQVTGTRMDLEIAAYSIRNASSLGGVAAVGLDWTMFWSALLAILVVILAARLARRAGRVRPRTVLQLAFTGLGVVLFVGAVPSAQGMNRQAVGSFLGGAWADLRIRSQTDYEHPKVEAVPDGRLPNFLVVIMESTRADALGTYRESGDRSDTPYLDSLASRGVVADLAYTVVTHTSKALVGIMCGAFPRLQTEIGEGEEKGIPMACLPKVLRDAGYRSRFMQTAVGDFEHRRSVVANIGFDDWVTRDELDGSRFESLGYLGMDERALVEPALEWVRSSEKPFLLTILTSGTHHPYQVPGQPPPESIEEHPAHYAKAVEYMDNVLEDFIPKVLRDRPDTIVILVGDHGEAFDAHAEKGHNLVPYEDVTRVPLILAGPESRIGTARRLSGLRHQIDIVPTALNLSGIRWNGNIPGQDLLASEGHEYVMSSCWQTRRCLALRVGDMKYVYRYGRGGTEVYDLSSDPNEQRNISSMYPNAVLVGIEAFMLEERNGIDQYYFAADRNRGR